MNKIIDQLECLEQELKQLGDWQSFPIEQSALLSTEPFCIDTMSLPQWLQFVFIPRLTALVEGGLALPSGSGVLPLAEEFYKNRDQANKLLIIIDKIDEALGRSENQ